MARTSQIAKVGRRTIELSNLQKVLFPESHILKAELIQYYLSLAPTILAHVKGRPLSLVRYPDGISGESFFQKNRPEWAPEWIEYVTLGEEKKDYILATEEASLVWLANLAVIELHEMHSRSPEYDKPDYMVFDLDPPEHLPFPRVADIALEFRDHIEGYGYHAFVKTTGRKGLHVVVPLERSSGFNEVFEAAKAIAQPFVDAHSGVTTLHIKKEARRGKTLVDIYRNRQSQTIVAPYSVRGLPGATVSTPLTWDELPGIDSPQELTIKTVEARVLRDGDPWEAIDAHAVLLHTLRRRVKAVTRKLAKSAHHKSPETLKEYEKKRSFERTPEPPPAVRVGEGNAFVVHRHHASRLHYDLRLERDGTLKSWAVPRGLPPRPGIIRLAVETEDHPLEYLNFEGTIPKGEYGGGDMWIFARGKYQVTKEKKKGFYFRLMSRELNAEYRTHQSKEKEWVLERVDTPQVDWLRDPVEPMLSQSAKKPPHSDEYLYEVKWDGIRALIALDEGEIRIRSRNQKDITAKFPELLIPDMAFRATSGLFDAEIVCLDDDGRPVFKNVIHRIQQTTDSGVARARAKYPAVCYIFDCLYLDGRPIAHEPLVRRRVWMADAIRKDTPYRVSEVVEDGAALFDAAAQIGLEGIMAKEKNSPYLPGKRSGQWIKIKSRQTMDCLIVGYTKGKGDRSSTFGALQIAAQEDGKLRYVGKVGTGFDARLMKEIATELSHVKRIPRPVREKPLDDASTVWLEPEKMCEVQYASLTPDGMLREPVFVRLRPDR